MGSTPYEAFRRRLDVRTADGDNTTLIVTRQSDCRSGPVWVTHEGSWRGTAALTDAAVDELIAALTAAKAARLGSNGSLPSWQ